VTALPDTPDPAETAMAAAARARAHVAAWTDRQTEADLRRRGGLKWSGTDDGVLGAWVAEMDLPLAPAITTALHAATDQQLTGYLPLHLGAAVGGATAALMAGYGWRVDPEAVHPVASVVAAARIVLNHLSGRAAPVVLPTPAYMPFLAVPELCGRELITVPMRLDGDRWELDLDGIRAALRPGALLLLTNPHNPTGRVFSEPELLAVADVVTETGATVFADEIHAPLVYPGHRFRPYASLTAETAAHTITGTSASKGWNIAGLGCAQLILPDGTRDRWERIDPVEWHGATPLGAVATVAAYTEGGEHIEAVVDYLRAGRDLFAEELARSLPSARFFPLEGTYLGWLDLRDTGCAPADVQQRASVRGVDGEYCGTPGFLRLNLAMPHHLVREMAERLGACGPER
jgi:bifunctional pyridoxal-dependent enzyme with beta-cystathionase and maltose regulon repressor activities